MTAPPAGFEFTDQPAVSTTDTRAEERRPGFGFTQQVPSTRRDQSGAQPLMLTIDGTRPHTKRSKESAAQGFTFVKPDEESQASEGATQLLTADDWPSSEELKPLRSLNEEPALAQPPVHRQTIVRRRSPDSRATPGTSLPAAGRVTIAESAPVEEPKATAAGSSHWWTDPSTSAASAASAESAVLAEKAPPAKPDSGWTATSKEKPDEFWMPTGETVIVQSSKDPISEVTAIGMQMLLVPVAIDMQSLEPAVQADVLRAADSRTPISDNAIFMPAGPGPEIVYTNVGLAKPESASLLRPTQTGQPTGPLRPSGPLAETVRTADLAIETAEQAEPAEHWTMAGHATVPGMDDSYVQTGALLLDDDLRSLNAAPLLPAQGEESTDSTSLSQADQTQREPAANDNVQTLGEEPEQSNEPLQFLRRQTILLEPGEFQFDVGLNYLNDTTDFPVVLTDDMGQVTNVLEGVARQRLLFVPLELRAGITKYTQGFVNVPIGWSHNEVAFNQRERTKEEGGIGDVSAGFTQQIVIGNEYYPDVLASVAFSAPSGNSSITTALGNPGSALGQGFWTLSGSLSFIQTYDPVVFFYGLGYTFRFESTFADVIEIDPGDQLFYRFGAGFAVNPHVTLSASFIGSIIGRDEVNGRGIAGSIREPMQIRLAATISRQKSSKLHKSFKLVEPFVNFGLNENSVDALIGVTWTH